LVLIQGSRVDAITLRSLHFFKKCRGQSRKNVPVHCRSADTRMNFPEAVGLCIKWIGFRSGSIPCKPLCTLCMKIGQVTIKKLTWVLMHHVLFPISTKTESVSKFCISKQYTLPKKSTLWEPSCFT
jgi:hypothetical protein